LGEENWEDRKGRLKDRRKKEEGEGRGRENGGKR